jgi:hypothetical protein
MHKAAEAELWRKTVHMGTWSMVGGRGLQDTQDVNITIVLPRTRENHIIKNVEVFLTKLPEEWGMITEPCSRLCN